MPRLCALLASLLLCFACQPAKVGNLQEPGPNAVEVQIRTEPSGAQIVVDGTPLPAGQTSIKLNPSPHSIKAMKSGYFPAEQRITVSGDSPAEVSLTLVASH